MSEILLASQRTTLQKKQQSLGRELTSAMKIKFHERYRRVNAVVERIVLAARPNPGKICLVEMVSKVRQPVVEDSFGIVCIEGSEELDNLLLLLGRK